MMIDRNRALRLHLLFQNKHISKTTEHFISIPQKGITGDNVITVGSMLYAIIAVLIDNEIIQRADAVALCAARIRAVALRIGIDQQNTFPVMCSHICQVQAVVVLPMPPFWLAIASIVIPDFPPK